MRASISFCLEFPVERGSARYARDQNEAVKPSGVIYLMVATLVAVVLYPHMVITVPSGHVGVLWKRPFVEAPRPAAS
jgi:hypothetical protein